MTGVRVYIATTEGPAMVQRIAEEDPDVQSLVCVDGGIEKLPISRGYHAFVARGTGIIERLYGHPAYRVDVDRAVDEGDSWQLPLLIAHHLGHRGRLCGSDTDPGTVLWATGTVNADCAVGRVNAVLDKLEAARPLFRACRDAGVPVILAVPPDNAADIPEDLSAIDLDPETTTVLRPGRATPADLDHGLSLDPPNSDGKDGEADTEGDPPGSDHPPRPRRRRWWPWGAAAALVVLAGAGAWAGRDVPRFYTLAREGDLRALETALQQRDGLCPGCRVARYYLDRRRLAPGAVRPRALETRPPEGGTCLRADAAMEGLREISRAPEDGTIPPTPADRLCGLAYRFTYRGDTPARVLIAARWGDGERRLQATLAPGESRTFRVADAGERVRPATYRFTVLATPYPDADLAAWRDAGDAPLAERAERLGLTLRRVEHHIEGAETRFR